MASSGLVDDFISDIGSAVDPEWPRGHLGYGHNVCESAFCEPGMGGDYLCLDERQHGVTSANGEYTDDEKHPEKLEEKHRIANSAAQMVHTGDTVLIDSGTTTFFIAQALSHHENLTIITNDLYIAYQTPLHPSSTLIVTGGTRRQGRQELVGTVTENFIRDTHVDIAFIGVDGIDLTGGATNANFAEVGVKRLMLEAASRSVIVADHSKFGRIALARICDIKEASLILTDTGIDGDMLTRLKKLGVQMETV